MATVATETIDVPIRMLVARPRASTAAVIVWSDIFQLTPPHVRMVSRLSSYGFTVYAPEIYSRFELPGTVLSFENDRQRALHNASRTELAWIDEERRAVIEHVKTETEHIGAMGFCFGGHLAFRAALEPEIRATACFYATGVHDGNLGTAKGTAGTLERAPEIRGELLLVWGANDPYIPADGRARIHRALEDSAVRYETRVFDTEHAFARDEGPRWDAEAADAAFAAAVALFRRRLR